MLDRDYKLVMAHMIALGIALGVERVSIEEWRQAKIHEHHEKWDIWVTDHLVDMRRDFVGAKASDFAVA